MDHFVSSEKVQTIQGNLSQPAYLLRLWSENTRCSWKQNTEKRNIKLTQYEQMYVIKLYAYFSFIYAINST